MTPEANDAEGRRRCIVAYGADDTLRAALHRHGVVTDLPLGLQLPIDDWTNIDLVVVHIRDTPGSPTAALASPGRTGALATMLATLRAAGTRGVERAVIEDGGPTQPHTGFLKHASEFYLAPPAQCTISSHATKWLSATADDIASAMCAGTDQR